MQLSEDRDGGPDMASSGELDLRAARRRLVEDVVAQLRQLILDQALPPGTTLEQTELAEKLGVTWPRLQEAFRLLQRDGLIKVHGGSQTIEVARYSSRELRELYEVREVIDGLAARLLTRKGMSDKTAAELTGLLDEMDAAAGPFQSGIWFPAHVRFHVAIAESCGNARLKSMCDLIRATSLSLHGVLSHLAETDPAALAPILRVAQEQHRAIHEALVSGDDHVAESRARAHIRATLRSGLIEQATGLGAA